MKQEKVINKKKLVVKMFGTLTITGMGAVLNEDTIHSEMMTKLLAYILYHRHKEITIQELSETLWQEDKSDNPAGALKNLMYRLRSLLKKTWGDHDFIQTGYGAYNWNKAIEVVVDAEGFDANCKEAAMAADPNIKINYYRQVVEAYNGLFLPKLSTEFWVTTLSVYYHSKWLTAAKELAGLLEREERFEEMAAVLSNALIIDGLDEDLHCLYIKALIGQKKTKLAMEQYKEAVNSLYENLGVAPSEELRQIYEELLKETNEKAADMSSVQKELCDDLDAGAFLCEYGVFKKTYHLELRRASRLGVSVYLALITVESIEDLEKDSSHYLSIINAGMDRLQQVLLQSLRAGDVVARYSGSQFIVLLPTCQYESAKMVMQRVETAFFQNVKKPVVELYYSLDEMIMPQ